VCSHPLLILWIVFRKIGFLIIKKHFALRNLWFLWDSESDSWQTGWLSWSDQYVKSIFKQKPMHRTDKFVSCGTNQCMHNLLFLCEIFHAWSEISIKALVFSTCVFWTLLSTVCILEAVLTLDCCEWIAGEIFDSKQLITNVYGSGNNWAVGNKEYGVKYREEISEQVSWFVFVSMFCQPACAQDRLHLSRLVQVNTNFGICCLTRSSSVLAKLNWQVECCATRYAFTWLHLLTVFISS